MRADQTQHHSAKPTFSAQNSLLTNRFQKKESAVPMSSSLDQMPLVGFRHYNSMGNASFPLAMDQTQKKTSRPSNLNSLISDFESLRQNFRSMASSDQRIVDRIQQSCDDQKFLQGTNSIRTSSGNSIPNDMVNSVGPTNYRYEVEEVHQVQGIDEAYQIRRLQQIARDMKRKLEEETSQANYYRFQVWMLQDVLQKNGIKVSQQSTRLSHGSSNGSLARSLPNAVPVGQVTSHIKEALENFMENLVTPRMEQIESYCEQLQQRIEGLANSASIQLTLKYGYLQNKQKYAGDNITKCKIEQLEKELERKGSELKLMEQSYNSKNSQLQKFREQVTDMVDKVRSDYQVKLTNLQGQLQARDMTIRELQEKLRQKAVESPKKKDQLVRMQKEVDKLTQLIEQLNVELDMKDERLADKQLRMIEMQAELQLNQKARRDVCNELETLRQQNQMLETRRQEQLKIEWPAFHSSMIDLEKSHILPNVVQTEVQTDPSISPSNIDKLNRKLQLSEETNNKLQEELMRLKGDSTDRKMYKSVLNSNLESKLSEASKLESRIPRSRRSLIHNEDNPQRKSTGNSENGVPPNTWSKLSGYKEVSLNFSMDQDNGPIGADLEEMITHTDYPFERLRLGNEQAIFLLMKMAQMIRCQRDEIREKKRQVNFMKSRNDPAREIFASRIVDIEQEDDLYLSDYSDTYSDRNGINTRIQKKGQWQLLERQSLQAIERLLDQVEGLQAELEKSQRNENNLIQMKELYKAEIVKLNRANEEYEVHYKEEVKRMTIMLQEYQENRGLESVKEVVSELARLINNRQTFEPVGQLQIQEYLRVLTSLLHLQQPASHDDSNEFPY